MAAQLHCGKLVGSRRLVVASAAAKSVKKVQFCTGKVCKKQGSQQVSASKLISMMELLTGTLTSLASD
jgi:hypothetical protein